MRELCQLAEALARAREKSSLGDEILAGMNQTGKFPLTSPGSGPIARGPTMNSSDLRMNSRAARILSWGHPSTGRARSGTPRHARRRQHSLGAPSGWTDGQEHWLLAWEPPLKTDGAEPGAKFLPRSDRLQPGSPARAAVWTRHRQGCLNQGALPNQTAPFSASSTKFVVRASYLGTASHHIYSLFS